MTRTQRRFLPCLPLLLCASILSAGFPVSFPAWAGPADFNLQLHTPPVILDSKAPPTCTVTWLLEDTSNNDVFAARMRIAPAETDTPVNGRMPCPSPSSIPPRMADSALDFCRDHATEARSCVFADMARGFETRKEVGNTAENAARCSSDTATHIALSCWMSNGLAVCDAGCGNSAVEAEAAAKTRCEDKQQRSCPITASVPVLGP
jgi:hypothetical protein